MVVNVVAVALTLSLAVGSVKSHTLPVQGSHASPALVATLQAACDQQSAPLADGFAAACSLLKAEGGTLSDRKPTDDAEPAGAPTVAGNPDSSAAGQRPRATFAALGRFRRVAPSLAPATAAPSSDTFIPAGCMAGCNLSYADPPWAVVVSMPAKALHLHCDISEGRSDLFTDTVPATKACQALAKRLSGEGVFSAMFRGTAESVPSVQLMESILSVHVSSILRFSGKFSWESLVAQVRTRAGSLLSLGIDVAMSQHERIPGGMFHDMPKLQILNLSRCSLVEDSVPEASFRNLPALRQLRFHHNSITRLDRPWFSDLPSLQVLGISENGMQTVTPDAFIGQHSLQALDVSFNRLTHLDSGWTGGALQNVSHSSPMVVGPVSPHPAADQRR